MIWNVKYHKNMHNIFGANYFNVFQLQNKKVFYTYIKYIFVHNQPDIKKNCTHLNTKKNHFNFNQNGGESTSMLMVKNVLLPVLLFFIDLLDEIND